MQHLHYVNKFVDNSTCNGPSARAFKSRYIGRWNLYNDIVRIPIITGTIYAIGRWTGSEGDNTIEVYSTTTGGTDAGYTMVTGGIHSGGVAIGMFNIVLLRIIHLQVQFQCQRHRQQ